MAVGALRSGSASLQRAHQTLEAIKGPVELDDAVAQLRAQTVGLAAVLSSHAQRGGRRRLRLLQQFLHPRLGRLDPQTGLVRAWVGSRDFAVSGYDRVARAKRQPGSTFKPFVYARALEEGFSPDDTFWDREVEIPLGGGAVWRPTNADRVSGEALTLRLERKPPADVPAERYHRRERPAGTFTRTIIVGERFDPDKTQATYKNGILRVALSRAAEAAPKRIAIQN